ncbi:hypothetical protein, partial [Pseudomonas aeruginosa]|uniref:hypothetical protein n=3 Tax=Pseudomonas aeruginosa TaxID=287 RepID=UPI001E45DE6A
GQLNQRAMPEQITTRLVMMIMPNSVWDISLLLLGESDTYEPDYHTHDESICRQQAVLAEEDAHQARRNGSGTDFS